MQKNIAFYKRKIFFFGDQGREHQRIIKPCIKSRSQHPKHFIKFISGDLMSQKQVSECIGHHGRANIA